MYWRTDINTCKSLRVEDQNIQVRFKSGVGITPSNANSCKGRPMINDNAEFVNISIVINHNCRTYGFRKCLKMYLSYKSQKEKFEKVGWWKDKITCGIKTDGKKVKQVLFTSI